MEKSDVSNEIIKIYFSYRINCQLCSHIKFKNKTKTKTKKKTKFYVHSQIEIRL